MPRTPIPPDRGLLVAAYRYAGGDIHTILYFASHYEIACNQGLPTLAHMWENKLRQKLLSQLKTA